MSNQSNIGDFASDGPSYAALKQEQKQLLGRIREFEKSFGQLVESGKAFFSYSKTLEKPILNYNGFQVWPEYCDGNLLIVNWKTDKPHKAELHFHEDSNEVLVVESGDAVVTLPQRNKVIYLNKESKRNIAYLLPREEHSLEITSQSAHGYAVLIPPDKGLIQKDGKCVYADMFGACHGKPDCQYR